MATVAAIRWQVPPSFMAGKTKTYGERLIEAVQALGQFFAARIEAYAKVHAEWTDRTGNARQGLTGRAIKTATGVVIVLFHAMFYGIFLEVKHAGRFAIILRTLETHYAQVIAAVKALIR